MDARPAELAATVAPQIREDLRRIVDLIRPGSRVLDVGCGDGELLAYLTMAKRVDARGIELSQDRVNVAVANGLSVIQGDADSDLRLYPDLSFDSVVLSMTLPALHDPEGVLTELVRIGRRAVVSIPNFGHWRVRLKLLLDGRMPMTDMLDKPWYQSANIHLCTIRDFLDLCGDLGIAIESATILDRHGRTLQADCDSRRANLLGQQAVFVLRRDAGDSGDGT